MLLYTYLGCYLLTDAQLDDRLAQLDRPREGGRPGNDSGSPDAEDTGDSNHPGDSGDSGDDDDSGGGGDSTDTGDSATPDEGCWALFFDDPTDFATVRGPKNVTKADAWTVEAWVYYESNDGSIFQKWGYNVEDRQLRIAGDLAVGAIATSSADAGEVYSSTAIERNEWTHLAMQWIGSSGAIELWVNGDKHDVDSPGGTPLDANADIVLGYINRELEVDAIGGAIADVRLSNNARYEKAFVPEAELVPDAATMGLWKFDEGDGAYALDTSVNKQDAQITGATWAKRPCR